MLPEDLNSTFFLSELNFLSSLLLVIRVMYLSRSRQKVRLYLFVYQGENSIKTIVSTLFFDFFLITIVLYIISILNSRLYIIRDIASIFIVTGTRVIKTETIERINESDEGSMQNVGKLKQLLSITIHLLTICRILIAVLSLRTPPSPSHIPL